MTKHRKKNVQKNEKMYLKEYKMSKKRNDKKPKKKRTNNPKKFIFSHFYNRMNHISLKIIWLWTRD